MLFKLFVFVALISGCERGDDRELEVEELKYSLEESLSGELTEMEGEGEIVFYWGRVLTELERKLVGADLQSKSCRSPLMTAFRHANRGDSAHGFGTAA